MAMTDTDILDLWTKYFINKDVNVKHKLIMHYIWLVKYVLNQMSLPVNTILNDQDFINIGILGLNDAIERYEQDRGVKFESFAVPRIRGTIQDELRRLDWLSRTARKKVSEFIQAGDYLRSKEGREVSPEEIRQKLNVTPEKYHSYLAAAAAAKANISLNEPTQIFMDDETIDLIEEFPDLSQDNYLQSIENEERINFLTEYLKKLNDKKRLVMMLYYYENLTFKEIGKTLTISESRVCQIHTQVVEELRKKLYEFDNA